MVKYLKCLLGIGYYHKFAFWGPSKSQARVFLRFAAVGLLGLPYPLGAISLSERRLNGKLIRLTPVDTSHFGGLSTSPPAPAPPSAICH